MRILGWSLVAAVILAWTRSAAAQTYVGDAPGCLPMTEGVPGGCAGKSVISGARVEPALSCLTLTPNNCNGGTLTIDNRCGTGLRLGTLALPLERVAAHSEPLYLQLYTDQKGRLKMNWYEHYGIHNGGRISRGDPLPPRGLSVAGKAGKKAFTLGVKGGRLVFVGAPACLKARVIELFGVPDVLELSNHCKGKVVLAGETLRRFNHVTRTSVISDSIELYKDASGRMDARFSRGNNADYQPALGERLAVEGSAGKSRFTLAYFKSGRLCP